MIPQRFPCCIRWNPGYNISDATTLGGCNAGLRLSLFSSAVLAFAVITPLIGENFRGNSEKGRGSAVMRNPERIAPVWSLIRIAGVGPSFYSTLSSLLFLTRTSSTHLQDLPRRGLRCLDGPAMTPEEIEELFQSHDGIGGASGGPGSDEADRLLRTQLLAPVFDATQRLWFAGNPELHRVAEKLADASRECESTNPSG